MFGSKTAVGGSWEKFGWVLKLTVFYLKGWNVDVWWDVI